MVASGVVLMFEIKFSTSDWERTASVSELKADDVSSVMKGRRKMQKLPQERSKRRTRGKPRHGPSAQCVT